MAELRRMYPELITEERRLLELYMKGVPMRTRSGRPDGDRTWTSFLLTTLTPTISGSVTWEKIMAEIDSKSDLFIFTIFVISF